MLCKEKDDKEDEDREDGSTSMEVGDRLGKSKRAREDEDGDLKRLEVKGCVVIITVLNE